MKKVLIFVLAAVMAITAFGLTACSGDDEKVINGAGSLLIFDLTNPTDVELTVDGKPDSIYKVQVGSHVVDETKYSYSGGKLTISKSEIGDSVSANKEIKVTVKADATPLKYRLIIATKVITDCNAFQEISKDLNGVYVLGADLDFEDFGNFNPIGNTGKLYPPDKIGLDFAGTLIGAGHTISNLTANADIMTDDEVYTEHDVYVDANNNPPTVRSGFGIFMRNAGTIEDICFKDCTVKNSAGTIMGLVVAVNEGEIKNVFVDGGKVQGGNIWLDYNCFNAGFAGINGGSAKITNCVSTVTQIKADPKGTLARAFCGKTWGEIKNCYACTDGIVLHDLATGSIRKNENSIQGIIGSDSAPELSDATGYGFTYKATESGSPMGSFDGCLATDAESLKQASLYKDYDKNVWNISENSSDLPTLKVLYSVSK